MAFTLNPSTLTLEQRASAPAAPAASLTTVYHDTNGRTWTELSSGLIIPLSPGPAFHVHKNGTDQTAVADSTFTLVTWSTELFDTHSYFASNRFTPLVAGKYILSATLTILTSTDAQGVYAVLYKNGARTHYGQLMRSPGTSSLGCSFCVEVDANGSTDYFECYILHVMTSTRTIEGNADETYFWGAYSGPSV